MDPNLTEFVSFTLAYDSLHIFWHVHNKLAILRRGQWKPLRRVHLEMILFGTQYIAHPSSAFEGREETLPNIHFTSLQIRLLLFLF